METPGVPGPPPTRHHHHRRRAWALLVRLFSATLPMRTALNTHRQCPICLDDVPTGGAGFALHCGHHFCLDCVRSFASGKVRERQVREDQLVCPVVECKRSLNNRDVLRILDRKIYAQYKTTMQRVRDETNPLALWCLNPQCSELVVCEANAFTFTCPSCATVGCFYCRAPAHRFAFLCRASPLKHEDAAYLKWEQSVGDGRAVRACPQCRMRIWKNSGCNRMTCAHCYHQYCWVCDAAWHRRHYACGEDADPRGEADAVRRRIAQLEIVVVGCIVALLACVAAITAVPLLALVAIARRAPLLLWVLMNVAAALAVGAAALVTLPLLAVLALRESPGKQKPKRRR